MTPHLNQPDARDPECKACAEMAAPTPEPQPAAHFTPIADVIAAHEQDPKKAAVLAKARERLNAQPAAQAVAPDDALGWRVDWPGEGGQTWHQVYINEADALRKKCGHSGATITALVAAAPVAPQAVEPLGVLARGEGGAFQLNWPEDIRPIYALPPGQYPLYAAPVAQPLTPLTDGQIAAGVNALRPSFAGRAAAEFWFTNGARFAERAHGISTSKGGAKP